MNKKKVNTSFPNNKILLSVATVIIKNNSSLVKFGWWRGLPMPMEVAVAALKVWMKICKHWKNLLCDWLVSEYIAPSGGVLKSSGTYNHKKKSFSIKLMMSLWPT